MESRGLLLPRKLARMGSIREDDARVHVCIHACSFLSVHSLILSLSLSLLLDEHGPHDGEEDEADAVGDRVPHLLLRKVTRVVQANW